jgi:hypothetical protein
MAEPTSKRSIRPARPVSGPSALGLDEAKPRARPVQAGLAGTVSRRPRARRVLADTWVDPARSAARGLGSARFRGCGRRLGSIYWRPREALAQAPTVPSAMTPLISTALLTAGSGGRVRRVSDSCCWVRGAYGSHACRPEVGFFTHLTGPRRALDSTHDSVNDALDPLRGDPLEGDPIGPGVSIRTRPDRARGSKVQIRRNPVRPGRNR